MYLCEDAIETGIQIYLFEKYSFPEYISYEINTLIIFVVMEAEEKILWVAIKIVSLLRTNSVFSC